MDVLRRPPRARTAHQVAALVFTLGAAQAFGQPAAIDFKGLALGASVTDSRTLFPALGCQPVEPVRQAGVGDTVCRVKDMARVDPGEACGNRHPSDHDAEYLRCRERFSALRTFAGIPLLRSPAFFFRDDRLVSVFVALPSERFDESLLALTGKYGAPTSVQREPLQNRMGAMFENVVAVWRLPDGVIRAAKYGSTITAGHVSMASADEVKRGDQPLNPGQASKDI